jgi:predicted Zn finger-like uncharacterized protein
MGWTSSEGSTVRLVCHRCSTRFRIADELIRGKIVRFRCKQCATILEARLSAALGGHVSAVTRPPLSPPRPPPAPSRGDWFLSLAGRQAGPMSTEELRARIRRREAGPDDLVWRQGLGMWQPVVAVEEIRDTLNEPAELSATLPPPLPPEVLGPSASSPVLQRMPAPGPSPSGAGYPAVIHYAVALPGPFPDMLHRPAPGERVPTGRPTRQVQWPLWVAILGAAMMTVATVTLLLRLYPSRASGSSVELGSPVPHRLQMETPGVDVPDELAGSGAGEFDPLEVPRSRGGLAAPKTIARPALPGQILPDHVAQLPDTGPPPLAEQLGTKPDDVRTAVAARVFRRNRSTLLACDQLAERRGETIRPGSRAVFSVRVSRTGVPAVEVTGQGLSHTTLSCYRTMAAQWQFPSGDTEYGTAFEHVH